MFLGSSAASLTHVACLLVCVRQVVTGGGDSVLNVWSDVTQEVEEEELRKAEELVQKEQALANYIYRKDYKKVRTRPAWS